MRRGNHWVIIIAVLILLVSWGSDQAQSSDIEYFPETGHHVKGSFLRFFNNVADPIAIYGYPITEQFTSKDGKTVQYFQRARFEQSGSFVILTPIGKETYVAGRQMAVNNPLACKSFSTGYSVCFAFLEFFEQNGEVARFGNPISPFEFDNDKIVQYFENARFEWHPDQNEGQQIKLTYLGRIYFDQVGEDPSYLRPVLPEEGGNAPRPVVLELKVRAFPAKAVTTSTDAQSIYILVQDQNLLPVANATGIATIRLPSGFEFQQGFTTSENGIGLIAFNFVGEPNGQLVNVDIEIGYEALKNNTTTSFRIWY